MLIDDTELNQEVGCGQIVAIQPSKIVVKTEDNQEIELKIRRKQKRDPIFWEVIRNIAEAGIWIPFSKKLKSLLEYDWLVPEVAY